MKHSLAYIFIWLLSACIVSKKNKGNSHTSITSNYKYDTIQKNGNHYVYQFITNLVAESDGFKTYPEHFTITLPPILKAVKGYSLNEFGFYYTNRQCMFIFIDLTIPNSTKLDTMFTPSESEIEDVIYGKVFYTWKGSKFNMDKNSLIKRRKSLIVKKDKTTILLYNIINKNYHSILSHIKTFKILDNPYKSEENLNMNSHPDSCIDLSRYLKSKV